MSGCAAPYLNSHLYPIKKDGKAIGVPLDPARVEIRQGPLPEGLALGERGTRLVVQNGYEGRYRLQGLVISEFPYQRQELVLRNLFWRVPLHSRHSRTRNDYCAVQAPLRALTLGVWDLVPFNYLCFVKYPASLEESLPLHLETLKKGVAQLGGNLLIVSLIEGEPSFTLKEGGKLDSRALAAKRVAAFAVYEQAPPR